MENHGDRGNMRIGIDASTIGTQGGPRTYVLNLIDCLLRIDRENEYVIFYNSKEHLGRFPQAREVVVPFSNPATRLFREHLLMAYHYKKERLDIIHNPKSAISRLKPCRTVATIFDLIPVTNPETEKWMARVYWKLQIPIAARYADFVITSSEFAKKEIIGRYGTPGDRIKVIPISYNSHCRPIVSGPEAEAVRKKYFIPDKYLLYVGTIQPRKNIGTLIKAYSSLAKAGKIMHKLVITGRKGWLYGPLFELIKNEGMEEKIVFTGFVPDEELPYIYNGADLFVYLSLFEGFGIPPLEAMACGVPVICSNTTSLPEVVGDAGILVAPADQKAVEEAILRIIGNPSLRKEMREKGLVQASRFSWERTARETLEVYREVVQGG